jgi:hypothetical protein
MCTSHNVGQSSGEDPITYFNLLLASFYFNSNLSASISLTLNRVRDAQRCVYFYLPFYFSFAHCMHLMSLFLLNTKDKTSRH